MITIKVDEGHMVSYTSHNNDYPALDMLDLITLFGNVALRIREQHGADQLHELLQTLGTTLLDEEQGHDGDTA